MKSVIAIIRIGWVRFRELLPLMANKGCSKSWKDCMMYVNSNSIW